jgi:protein-L-isoaspartate O-methyltransferase
LNDRRALPALYVLAILASAALLFVAEPMAAKLVLPLLGGAPAVWNGCMLFFQAALLAGYLYAHLLGRLPPRAQVTLHAALLAVAFVSLPLSLGQRAAGPGASAPLPWLLVTLAVIVGFPFFVLAATGPLLQRWFSRTDHPDARDPYFLYAASNAGSLAGLLAYPFVLEPSLRILTPGGSLVPLRLTPWSQSTLFTAAFAACGLLTIASGFMMLWRRLPAPRAEAAAAGTARERLTWVVLAAIPASLVLGATQYVTTDVAVVPLLWVVPLCAYLLSFVLAFSRRPIGSDRFWGIALGLTALGATLGFWALSQAYAWVVLILHPLVVLSAGMVCHRRLASSRPPAARLTEFYLCLATGGVAGGAFNAVVAPLLFPAIIEYPLVLLAACFVRVPQPAVDERRARRLDVAIPVAIAAVALILQFAITRSGWDDRGKILLVVAVIPCALAVPLVTRPRRFALALAVLMAIAWYQGSTRGTVRHRERTFFGVYRVIERPGPIFTVQDAHGKEKQFRIPTQILYHGTTHHGLQVLDANLRDLPTSYYHRSGPLGQLFAALGAARRLDAVAVIGAGAGTIAAYGQPGRRITFYEIDPAIVRIARDPSLFTFVRDSRGEVGFVVGDGRLQLAAAADGSFDLIVVDAFSSDAIPVHLLTREAIALYLRKLRPGGVIALHITNQNLDLVPVVDALTADADLAGLVQDNEIGSAEELIQGKDVSQWAVIAKDRSTLAPLAADSRWQPLPIHPGRPPDRRYLWTDDYSSLFSVVALC